MISMDVTQEQEDLSIKMEQIYREVSSNYSELQNKPTLNGVEIMGAMTEIDPTVPEWAKQQQKPAYSTDEIGAVDAEDEMTILDVSDMFNRVFNN